MIFIASDVFMEIIKVLFQDGDEIVKANGEWLNPSFVNKKGTYVSFYAHVLHHQPKDCIIYNLDSDETLYGDDFFLHNLRKASKIYDFSPRNIKFFKKIGINAEWKPIIWNSKFEICSILSVTNRQYDILFLGMVNARRNSVLNRIIGYEELTGKKLPFLIVIVSGVYSDEQKSKIIQNSKMCISINQVDKCSTVASRIIPMVSNKVRILSERSDDTELDEFYDDIVDWIPAHVLKDAEYLVKYLYDKMQNTTDKLLDERYIKLRCKGTFSPLI